MRIILAVAAVFIAVTCMPGAERDAVALSAEIRARHLPFGTVLDPIFASPQSNEIVGYTRCGDSAIWTGHYLAAEAFRYSVTHEPEALKNVRGALEGIKLLVDVTGTDLLARCAVPADSPYASGIENEEAHNGINANAALGYMWFGRTSRDQYSGLMFGLAVAYDMVDDAAVRAHSAALLTRIVDFLRGNSWTVYMPDGSMSTSFIVRPDQILTFLQIARRVNPERFSHAYDSHAALLGAAVSVPISIDAGNDDSYYKFNLDYINLYNLVRLESGLRKSSYLGAYQVLRRHTATHQNAFFNMIDRALRGSDQARDEETVALLDQWLARPRRDFPVDLRTAVPVCGDHACQAVPVVLRPPTDFLWQRTPFQLAGGGDGLVESPGIDYILPYWMARYYGVLSGIVMQPAASPGDAVAPDSLASIYGSKLTSVTEQAGPPPLPTTLGGVSVRLRDAAGVERDARLLYVSPRQINLLVPVGAAPGEAMFTISNGGAVTENSTILVQPVAPSLFSVNGTGEGVAAATAVRVQFLRESAVAVFECNNSGCASTPIELSTDAPLYLTLYATGVRHRSSVDSVSVNIAGERVTALYAGAQPQYPGLDQINVELPASLRGAGEASLVVNVDGKSSNTVTVNVR